MAATRTTVSSTVWVECAADISALKLIQVSSLPSQAHGLVIMLAAAASDPGDSVIGIELVPGDTAASGAIADIGASGKLRAKTRGGNAVVITL